MSEQRELVDLIHSIVIDNGVTWYHAEEKVIEANTGASSIGSQIIFWLIDNINEIPEGIISSLIFLHITKWWEDRKKDRSPEQIRTQTKDYVSECNKNKQKIKELFNEDELEVISIRTYNFYTKYEYKSRTHNYEIEETPQGIRVKKSEIVEINA